MKISRADTYSPIPKTLFESNIPSKIFFRLQRRQWLSRIRIKPENLVLAARRTESGRHACVQRRVRFVDLITARRAIGPNVSELIEVIDASAGIENEMVDVERGLQKSRDLFGFVADEVRTE